MADFVYNDAALKLQNGSINWGSDTIKARLVASSVTPDKDDTVMTGYTAIGTDQTLGSKTGPTKDTANDRITYDAADPSWTAVASGSTVGFCVIYKFVTNDGDSIPIACLDLTDTPTNGGNMSVTLNAIGAFYTQE